jgi:hypothetical protein
MCPNRLFVASPHDWNNGTVVTSQADLNFTQYCHQDLYHHVTDDSEAENLQDCIENCTDHIPACFGVAWSPLYRQCFRKDYYVTVSDLRDGPLVSALVILTQDAQQANRFVCPYRNLSTQKVQSGMDFTIFRGGFYTFQDVSVLNRVHVELLDACMERCASYHPLCFRLSYVANFIGIGWLNCVLLSAN